jgi:2-oxoglutarate ferredoxin oxidoreductase subunit gamma
MRFEVRVGGFGGQGVITMGHLLGTAASLHIGLNAVMTESYGPEARGGACTTDIVVSDAPIDYPKTTTLDCLVAMNPDAYNSYKHDVKKGGAIIYDSSLFEVSDKTPGVKYYPVGATRIAQELKAPQVANVVMLGAVSHATGVFPLEAIEKAVKERFPKAATVNVKALQAGVAATG